MLPAIFQTFAHVFLYLPPILSIWLQLIFGGPSGLTKFMIEYWALYLGFLAHIVEVIAFFFWEWDPIFVVAQPFIVGSIEYLTWDYSAKAISYIDGTTISDDAMLTPF